MCVLLQEYIPCSLSEKGHHFVQQTTRKGTKCLFTSTLAIADDRDTSQINSGPVKVESSHGLLSRNLPTRKLHHF